MWKVKKEGTERMLESSPMLRELAKESILDIRAMCGDVYVAAVELASVDVALSRKYKGRSEEIYEEMLTVANGFMKGEKQKIMDRLDELNIE